MTGEASFRVISIAIPKPVESSMETRLFVPKEERAMLQFFTRESY